MTASQVGGDIAAVARIGVDAVHVHVKHPDTGVDTLDASPLADVLTEARQVASKPPIGVTTGAWAEPDVDARLAAIRGWTVLPDFASVNWHEDGAEQVSVALLDRGVEVEAGLWHAEVARFWLQSPLRDQCLRVLLELQDGPDDAGTAAEAELPWLPLPGS